mgnify:CR=1 FL=1
MTTDIEKTTTSFGRYLQAKRIEKGISLEAVSKETRIRMETLLQIEKEEHQNLPDEVFVRGFLRAYARAIGADGDEAMHRYNSRLAVICQIATSEADLEKSSARFWQRLAFCLAAFLCLMVLSIFAASRLDHQTVQEVSPESKNEQKQTTEGNADDAVAPVQDPEPVKEPDNTTPEKYLLRIETNEETWLKVIIDGQEPNEYSLYPGDHVELEASSGYNLLIGNSTGVKMFLNSDPVEVPGKSGQVVNIELP